MQTKHTRIGIFRGTFDPIHEGHISFAIKSINETNLDQLYFLPEPKPFHKTSVSNFSHRLAMIKQAIKPYPKIGILDQEILHGSIGQIVPVLKNMFTGSTLIFLMGSDIAKTLPQWNDLSILCKDNEIVVALRNQDEKANISDVINSLKLKPVYTLIVSAPMAEASSSIIRKAVLENGDVQHIDSKVYEFIKNEQLYQES